ncbi:MAG: serine hydrolase [Leeuwenhoekiella sp.]
MIPSDKNPALLLIIFLLYSSLSGQTRDQLSDLLSTSGPEIARVMYSLSDYELQIQYTRISRDSKDNPVFKTMDYQVDSTHYFYPASSVKFPVAVLALEKFIGKKLKSGKKINLDTPYKIDSDTVISSLRKDVEAIFAVSDNEAYNRLYELLGRDSINTSLKNIGIKNVKIVHRLSTPNSAEAVTKAVIFNPEGKYPTIFKGYRSSEIAALQFESAHKGVGYTENDSLISGKFDFSKKNYFPISAQQELMKRVIFPLEYAKDEHFNLDKKTRTFLLDAMHKTPRNLGYDEAHYQDSYGKFFIFGDSKEEIPRYIQIFNKVGYAYGTLTDNAYIKDTKNKVEFLLTATILVNQNEVFNDGVYEFDTMGIPFLAKLGRIIYDYELGLQQKGVNK